MVEETKQYEIRMYKLVILIFIGIFIALGIGFYFGDRVGTAEAAGNIDVQLPDYCTYRLAKADLIVTCNELEDLNANDVCNMLSTPLKDKIHVVITT